MELLNHRLDTPSRTSPFIEESVFSTVAKAGFVGALTLLPLQPARCAPIEDLSTAAAIVRPQDSCVNSTTIINRKFERIEFQAAASDLLSSSATLLGSNSYERFKKFIEYPDGWGGGIGKKISTQSVAALQNFLSDGQTLWGEPSIFLKHDGNLQVAWEDVNGNAIELDFLPSGIAFFYEKTDEEMIFNLDTQSISSLKENLSSLLLS